MLLRYGLHFPNSCKTGILRKCNANDYFLATGYFQTHFLRMRLFLQLVFACKYLLSYVTKQTLVCGMTVMLNGSLHARRGGGKARTASVLYELRCSGDFKVFFLQLSNKIWRAYIQKTCTYSNDMRIFKSANKQTQAVAFLHIFHLIFADYCRIQEVIKNFCWRLFQGIPCNSETSAGSA